MRPRTAFAAVLLLVLGRPCPAAAMTPAVFFDALVLTGEPAPGVPGSEFVSLYDPQRTPTGALAFSGAVSEGPNATGLTDSGLWGPDGFGGIELVARKGDVAPGTSGGRFATVDGHLLDSGEVVVSGALRQNTGDVVFGVNDRGIWAPDGAGGLALAVRTGTPAPDGPAAAVLGTILPPAVSGSGRIAFAATFEIGPGGVTADDRVAIFASDGADGFSMVARMGSTPPAGPAGAILDDLGWPEANRAGDVAFIGSLQAGIGGVTAADDRVVYAPDGLGGLGITAREGQASPGGGPIVGNIGSGVALSDSGEVAFHGASNGDPAIWIPDGAGGLRVPLRVGAQAPGLSPGLTVTATSGFVVLNDLGDAAFSGVLERVGPVTLRNDAVLWGPDGSGGDRIALREGDPVLDMLGVTVSNPVVFGLNNRGDVLVRGDLLGGPWDGSLAAFLATFEGALVPIIWEGQSIEVAPGDTRVVLDFTLASATLNDRREILLTVEFTDESAGILLARVPEPALGLHFGAAASLLAMAAASRRRTQVDERIHSPSAHCAPSHCEGFRGWWPARAVQ